MSKSTKKPAGKKAAAKEPRKTAVVKPVKDASVLQGPMAGLVKLNKRLAIAYIVQALVLIILAAAKSFPVTVHFLGVDSFASAVNGGANGTVYAPASHQLFALPLVQVLALSLTVSAAFHGLSAAWGSNLYASFVRQGVNPLRWMENAFSASLLPVAIGLVAGVQDIAAILMLFALGFIAHIMGWQMESDRAAGGAGAQLNKRRSFIAMAVAAGAAWLALGYYLLGAGLFGNGVAVYTALAYGFGLAGVLLYGALVHQYCFGDTPGGGVVAKLQPVLPTRWSQKLQDYARLERWCMMLSFCIKTLVVWQLFAGALRP